MTDEQQPSLPGMSAAGETRRKRWGDQLTAGGFRLDEAVSSLQKCIRRGRELESAFWADESDWVSPARSTMVQCVV